MRMKIFIDNIVFHLQKRGGISVVWKEIISRLLNDKAFDTCFIEYGKPDNLFRKNIDIDNSLIVNKKQSLISFKRYLNPSIECDEKFIFHSTYYRTCKNKNAINITTVHDFTYEYFFPFMKRTIHKWQKYNAIQNSDFVVCVSENTKKDCLRFVKGLDENKCRVIYNGVSEEYFPIADKSTLKLPFEVNSYFVFVGDRSHYKNFQLAVEFLKHGKLNMVIVGNQLNDNELSMFNNMPADKKHVVMTGISNEELNKLYNGAFCLVYPSSYEGFGIPVVEAQRAGCPVIAFNNSSIPEIIGHKSFLMQEPDADEICMMAKKLENQKFRDEIIYCGLENSKRFTWDETYAKLVDLYKEAFLKKKI